MAGVRWIGFIGGLVAVAIVLAACGSDEGVGGETAASGRPGHATGGGTTITIERAAGR